jgi:membrane-bound ClpP family serine protease
MDRIVHNVTPIVASVILLCGGAGLIAEEAFAPFAIAGSATLFLVSGIYRTWGETLALIELSDKS